MAGRRIVVILRSRLELGERCGGAFLRDEFSGVSSVLGCYAPGAVGMSAVQVAYNPFPLRPIAPGQLGTGAEEWPADLVAEDDKGIEWSVERLPDP